MGRGDGVADASLVVLAVDPGLTEIFTRARRRPGHRVPHHIRIPKVSDITTHV